MSYVHAYLRASTEEQDANRARKSLEDFAAANNTRIAGWYVEQESGAKLARPELFRLLDNTQPGDVLLLEQIDRLSRLNAEDWDKLRGMITAKGVRIVSLDMPTSHTFLTVADEFTARMMGAINGMMLDMLAAIARKDYTDRRRRQAEGIVKAKAAGRYKPRTVDLNKQGAIISMLRDGKSYGTIEKALKVSRATIAKASKAMKAE
jgi:DNA invertase Pin-like site-specific DNA recombinase